VASLIYDSYFDDLNKGNIVPNTDTFKGMLVTSTYSPNKGTHTKRSDITNEVSGTGYTAGGTSVTCTVSLDTTNHRSDVTISGPSWANSSITARALVVYKSRGGASSADNLVAYIDFTSDVTSTNATFSVTISSPLRIQN
jgi:hypothetical protein